MKKTTYATIIVALFTCLLAHAEDHVMFLGLKIIYSPKDDGLKEITGISPSGATIIVAGKEVRIETTLTTNDKSDLEQAAFAGLDPSRSYKVSVKLRGEEMPFAVTPKKGYKNGEHFVFEVPPGPDVYSLQGISCEGKKFPVWTTYALISGDDKIIPSLGFEKGCKRHWHLGVQ